MHDSASPQLVYMHCRSMSTEYGPGCLLKLQHLSDSLLLCSLLQPVQYYWIIKYAGSWGNHHICPTNLGWQCMAHLPSVCADFAVPYKGPDTFKRCLAARQLAWIIQQLQAPHLAQDTCGLLLPLVLATADDPAPAVQQYGHAMLSWIAVHCQAGSLSWQRVLLLDEAKRLVVGCEESCWKTAMPAATNLVMVSSALEGCGYRFLTLGVHWTCMHMLSGSQACLVVADQVLACTPYSRT